MELIKSNNPYYEKWKVGRPSFAALEKRAKYWEWERQNNNLFEAPKCYLYTVKTPIKPAKV